MNICPLLNPKTVATTASCPLIFLNGQTILAMFADIHHIHVMSKLDWSWGSWEGAKGSGDEGANVFGGIGRAPCEPAWDNIWYPLVNYLLRRQCQPCDNGFAGVLHHTATVVKMMLSSLLLTKVRFLSIVEKDTKSISDF
jgi:hypothetical protein